MNINFKDIFIIIVLSYILYNVYYTVEYLEDEKNKNNTKLVIGLLVGFFILVLIIGFFMGRNKTLIDSYTGEPITDLRGQVTSSHDLAQKGISNCQYECNNKFSPNLDNIINCWRMNCDWYQ